MKIRQIEFPDKVIDAQNSGELVIFAGAGVSMAPPSNYPDFEKLAVNIGGDTNPKEVGENIDRYFGRLVAAGVPVHERVQRTLSSPESKPNVVHNSLLGIFRTAQKVRIVTTNFDSHFSTAARERFGAEVPELFFAPALPIGSDFTGIVHLHGSVEKPANRLVLTDADFGRAYITEGWATRFLERLFATYVVLFVGYSHRDVLLNYLARGLTPGALGPGRFVLTHIQDVKDEARWKNLGIMPVNYPLCEPPEHLHSQLGGALSAWDEQSQAGALEIEKRIRNLVTGGVPLEQEELDFLERALRDISSLRFFVRYARGVEWLHWIERQPCFQDLFTTGKDYSELHHTLARWLASEYVGGFTDEMFDLLRRNNWRLSPLIWNAITGELFAGKPTQAVLSTWVPILLSSDWQNYEKDLLEYILGNCRYPDNSISALLLFDSLTKPTIRLKKSFRMSEKQGESATSTTVEVVCSGSDHGLGGAWSTLFEPNLQHFAKQLIPVITSHLTLAYRLHASYGVATDMWDPISFDRGMIESRQQDHLFDGFSVLLEVSASVMRWVCDNDRVLADALIAQWFTSESVLLKRLAIYGTGISRHIEPDAKLRWLSEEGLIYALGIKHEVFLVMKEAYPKASHDARQRFLEEVQRADSEIVGRDIDDYEVFNVASWLAAAAPECEFTAQFVASVVEHHPEYQRREHPDMDHWIGPVGYYAAQSPVTESDLVSSDLDELIALLERTPDATYPGTASKEGLSNAISGTATRNHDWGIRIAEEAQSRFFWSGDLWRALAGAWSGSDLTADEWEAILHVLKGSPAVHEAAVSEIASLLDRGIQNAKAPIPSGCLDQARVLAVALWAVCEHVPSRISGEDIDWLTRAINHPVGSLYSFHLNALSRLKREKVLTPEELVQYERIFESAIEGTLPAAKLARVILATRLHFLFFIDEKWTMQKVFPLLDPQIDSARAAQCWHGYLYWGKWSDSMLVGLLPLYEKMLQEIDSQPREVRRSFYSHLAGISVYSLVHPLEDGWLTRFIARATTKSRAAWAGQLGYVMGELKDQAKLHLWQRWLKRYWEDRLAGVPIPLHPNESSAMLEWLLNLEPCLPEVVDMICAGPYPAGDKSTRYYSIAESDLLERFADAFAKLLLFLAAGEGTRPIYDLYKLEEAVSKLVDLIPENRYLPDLCDHLARLGVTDVNKIVAKLKTQ